jgi:hypothetical protein
MGQITISTPFLRSISHSDVTVGITKSQIVTPPSNISEKRVAVIVQNKSSTASIQVIGNATDTVGLLVGPLSTITLDNYNGSLFAVATAAGTTVHIAISSV